jgi:RNA polymerase sigma-70 factor (ECF subfamily)
MGAETFEDELTSLLPRLRRFAHGLSRSAADADDLTQMTIERALRSRAQWQVGTRLDSWTYRIMRNLWIDTARARIRRDRFEAPAEEAESIGEDPREAIEASLELKRVMAAMARLPDEQREVVALILIEGFGYREAAEMLALPVGTVSSRLVRGRTALLAMVGEQ